MKRRILSACLAFLLAFGMLCPVSSAAETERDRVVEEWLSRMTLREKVCQMMVVYQYKMPNPLNPSGTVGATETGDILRLALEEYPVGGILYDAKSMTSHAQLTNLVETAQSYSEVPLLFSIDEEGGVVARIGNKLGYTRGAKLKAMQTYQSQGPAVARSNALFLAQNIKDHGFNWDYAPVADVNSNPVNPVIGTRAYADTFDDAEILIPAAVGGFHDGGVACSLKHFPGHGDTSGDTHAGATYTYKTMHQIRKEELRSFQAGIDAGADSVMIAHIIVEELGVPSLFSEELLTTVLRDEMGYKGVLVSDGLTMQAMTDEYSSSQIAMYSINAGIDVLLCINDLPEAIDTILHAVEYGELSEDRIDESVRRILGMKYDVGLLTGVTSLSEVPLELYMVDDEISVALEIEAEETEAMTEESLEATEGIVEESESESESESETETTVPETTEAEATVPETTQASTTEAETDAESDLIDAVEMETESLPLAGEAVNEAASETLAETLAAMEAAAASLEMETVVND